MRIKRIWHQAVSIRDQNTGPGIEDYSRKSLISAALVIAIMISFATVANVHYDLPAPLFLTTCSGVVFYFLCYIVFRNTSNQKIYIFFKWAFSLGTIVLVDFIWFYSYASIGPSLFIEMVVLTIILLIWEGVSLWINISLYSINIFFLYFLEMNYPDLFTTYNDPNVRLQDIYIGLITYSVILTVVVSHIKFSFIREKEKAIQSDKLKSAFLANLSHEIRTPMNAIIGFSDLLSENTDTEKMKKYVKLISDNGNSLIRIIDDIIQISKIESGDHSIYIGETEIPVLFNKLETFFRIEKSRYGKENLEIRFNSESEIDTIKTDRFKLLQILSSLVSNAVKFSDDGFIIVTFKSYRNNFEFSVKDEGYGIPTEYQGVVFDKFWKLETNDPRLKGTGIGLSIAKDFISLLNGKMWMESELGSGSTFYIRIPEAK